MPDYITEEQFSEFAEGLLGTLKGLSDRQDVFSKVIEKSTVLANSLTAAAEHIKTLEFQLHCVRLEHGILAKIVAHMMGRECIQARNPQQHLDAVLSVYSAEADVFASLADDTFSDELRKMSITPREPTPEELKEREEHQFIAGAYRGVSDLIRQEAMKVVNASKR